MPIGLRGLSVNDYMLAHEQAPRQPYIRFRSDRHYGALPATHKNTHLWCSQKWSKTGRRGRNDAPEVLNGENGENGDAAEVLNGENAAVDDIHLQ